MSLLDRRTRHEKLMDNPTYRRKYQPLPSTSPVPTPVLTAGRWDFWELWSGSGTLTKAAQHVGLSTGPLVSREYGWELSLPSHQTALLAIYEEHLPIVLFGAPTCSPWSSSNTTMAKDVLDQIRAIESETFEFYLKLCKRQHNRSCFHITEQPRASELLRTADALSLCTLYGAVDYMTAMCAHGLVDAVSLKPHMKATTLRSSLPLVKSIRWCTCV